MKNTNMRVTGKSEKLLDCGLKVTLALVLNMDAGYRLRFLQPFK